ncbi:MAG: type 4a pilus biogenesis protein PilO [Bacillota bacterium]
MTPRKRALQYAALLVVALAFAGYVVYAQAFMPLSREARSLSLRVKATRQKIESLPKTAEALARLREEHVQTVEALEELESAVTQAEGMPYFLRDLERASSASGVTVVSVSAGSLTSSSPYAELPVAIGISGSYVQVKAFVDELLSLGRAMSVRTLRLSASRRSNGSGGAPVLDATLAVVLYIMPEGGRRE